MKKILIVSNTSWFVYNFLLPSIREFMKAGYDIVIVTPIDMTSNNLSKNCTELIHYNIERSKVSLLKELETLLQLLIIFYREKPCYIFSFTIKVNIYATLISRLLCLPIINTVSGLGHLFCELSFRAMSGKALLRLTRPFVTHTIFQNKYDLKAYLFNGFSYYNKISRVNGIGIDLKKFTPYCALNKNKVRFILVSRMLYTKGVKEFVAAANLIKGKLINSEDIDFSLLGSSDPDNPRSINESELVDWSKKGMVNYIEYTDDVFSVVKNYDCVVLPSYYREGMPQCLIEAAAMAKPIITTGNPGCCDIIEEGNTGFLVEEKNVESLINGIMKMVKMGYVGRLTMGQKGRIKAENEFCHLNISRHYLSQITNLNKNP